MSLVFSIDIVWFIGADEAVFGCLLENVSPNEAPRVPEFVQECIRCIESSEENMKTDGLYRASGNLSQVQKIRLQVILLRTKNVVFISCFKFNLIKLASSFCSLCCSESIRGTQFARTPLLIKDCQ